MRSAARRPRRSVRDRYPPRSWPPPSPQPGEFRVDEARDPHSGLPIVDLSDEDEGAVVIDQQQVVAAADILVDVAPPLHHGPVEWLDERPGWDTLRAVVVAVACDSEAPLVRRHWALSSLRGRMLPVPSKLWIGRRIAHRDVIRPGHEPSRSGRNGKSELLISRCRRPAGVFKLSRRRGNLSRSRPVSLSVGSAGRSSRAWRLAASQASTSASIQAIRLSEIWIGFGNSSLAHLRRR